MKWVLIVLVTMSGGSGLALWEQPALTTATFDDREACDAAASHVHAWTRDRRLNIREVRVVCVQQKSGPLAPRWQDLTPEQKGEVKPAPAAPAVESSQ